MIERECSEHIVIIVAHLVTDWAFYSRKKLKRNINNFLSMSLYLVLFRATLYFVGAPERGRSDGGGWANNSLCKQTATRLLAIT